MRLPQAVHLYPQRIADTRRNHAGYPQRGGQKSLPRFHSLGIQQTHTALTDTSGVNMEIVTSLSLGRVESIGEQIDCGECCDGHRCTSRVPDYCVIRSRTVFSSHNDCLIIRGPWPNERPGHPSLCLVTCGVYTPLMVYGGIQFPLNTTRRRRPTCLTRVSGEK